MEMSSCLDHQVMQFDLELAFGSGKSSIGK